MKWLFWTPCWISSASRSSVASHLLPYLLPRNIECFTDLPFGIVTLPRAHERQALIRQKLQGCDIILYQAGYNGSNMEEVAEFVPVSHLIQGLKDAGTANFDAITTPKQVGRTRREALISYIRTLSHGDKSYLWDWANYNELIATGHGHSISTSLKEQALYMATQLLLIKLRTIAQEIDAPCILTLEDDVVLRPARLHARTLRGLCEAQQKEAETWQLFWRWLIHNRYTKLAESNQDLYVKDLALEHSQYWGTCLVMWNTHALDKIIVDLAYDEDDISNKTITLDCHGEYGCVTDMWAGHNHSVHIPITPYATPPLLDLSFLRKIDLATTQTSARAQWAAYYAFETTSLGTVFIAVNESTHLRSEHGRTLALEQYRMSSKKFMTALGTKLGLEGITFMNATAKTPANISQTLTPTEALGVVVL
eukprot:Blabericola_migrator_1__10083@NODE_55_length_16001_cov_154_094327_g51_i0_p6_GENE_NODE_55_length_16001_cov_154_094327_g51_i0NODE_55_length_16001_cov_154_094327_g51_i0_p6_ORF_typecomplete_len423_score33_13DDE_Tnp_Tn3/PF01526_17/0_015_NODE_55_length_16001_cov_154_094327_g51_i01471715985